MLCFFAARSFFMTMTRKLNWILTGKRVIKAKLIAKLFTCEFFSKNQIKLVKVVGVNLDKLTCATLPAAAPICKQPKVWLKQVPIVALFGPIFQLSWFWLEDILLSFVFHTWLLCDLMFANPLPTVEELWKPRKAADDKGILKRGHIPGNAAPQRFSAKKKATWLFAWW